MNTVQNPRSGGVTLADLLRLLLRHIRALLISGAALGVAVGLVAAFLITPKYESRVIFYVSNKAGGASDVIDSSDLQAAESLAESYAVIVQSNDMLDGVIALLGDRAEAAGLTRRRLVDMIRVRRIEDTPMLKISVTSSDAELAYRIADCYLSAAPSEFVRITKAGSVEVVDSPERPDRPSSPNVWLCAALGFFGGVAAAALVVLVRTRYGAPKCVNG